MHSQELLASTVYEKHIGQGTFTGSKNIAETNT
jgi:hypothetical protein